MLPFLEAVADSQDHVVNDIVNTLADRFHLTQETEAYFPQLARKS
jgi:hypothetical protein